MSGLLASADGFIDPDRSWRRHRCRHRAARTAACRLVGRRGTGHLARPRLAGIAAADRRPGHPDDRTPQHQPFVVRAAAGGLVDLVAVPPLRQWTRGQRTHALVLGDPAGLDHPSTAGRVHRLRHPAVVAVAAASYDVVERVHHRPGVHAVAVAGLRGGLVCARAPVCAARAGDRVGGEHRVSGLVVDCQATGRPPGRSCAGGDGPGRCAAVLGTDAAQHLVMARGGDDAQRLCHRRAFAGGRHRPDALPRVFQQHPGIGRSGQVRFGASADLVQSRLHARASGRR